MLPARRLDQQPTVEELQVQESLLVNKVIKSEGYGVSVAIPPALPLEKPADVPPVVREWLDNVTIPVTPTNDNPLSNIPSEKPTDVPTVAVTPTNDNPLSNIPI